MYYKTNLKSFDLPYFKHFIYRRLPKILVTESGAVSGDDLPVFTFCSRDQYQDEVLQHHGIQSSSSYAMDHDWVGAGDEDPRIIFEQSVMRLENIVLDVKIYLDNSTPEGQSIIRDHSLRVC